MNIFSKWFGRTPEKPIPTDYGRGFEARQLVNGKWVLWHKGEACDLRCAGLSWPPGDRYFDDCMGTRKEVDKYAKDIMSAFGVFKRPAPEDKSGGIG